jgi:ABC-2 type transport system permease protein/oleandomycin transport system permease protein
MNGRAMTPAELRWVITDALVLTRRNLLKYTRVPTLLAFSTIQPVMLVLLFTYVFGGAIGGSLVPGTKYVDFLMPGIFVQVAVFGSTVTGVALADDMSKGLIDRFRSLPMSRSAVLAGRTTGDLIRNLFVVALITVVATLIGFRFHAGIPKAVVGLVLAAVFGFAFSWISATIGLAVKDVEAAQAAGFVWVFPLVFASSAFVPVTTMPDWLQTFAEISPVTVTVDSIRALVLGGPIWTHLWKSLAWIIGILAVFIPLAIGRYRKAV